MAQTICSWVLPPILGQVVMIDPSSSNAERYSMQSTNGTGYIRTVSSDVRMAWYRINESTKMDADVEVQWDNGQRNHYYLRDLLPFANKFKDLARYEFNRGDSLFGVEELLQTKLDRKIIYEGKNVVDKKVFGEEYRTRVMRDLARKYRDVLASGNVNEYQLATIEELIKMGLLDAPPAESENITAEQIGESHRIIEASAQSMPTLDEIFAELARDAEPVLRPTETYMEEDLDEPHDDEEDDEDRDDFF